MPAPIKACRCGGCGAKVFSSTMVRGRCVSCRSALPEVEDDLEVALAEIANDTSLDDALAKLRDDPTLEILLAKIRDDKRLNAMLAEMAHEDLA